MASPVEEIIAYEDVRAWTLRLYDVGLRPIACWGGGKYPLGTDLRSLSDNPPDRETVGSADYRGGLALLGGTHHPLGGFIIGGDIDEGPPEFPVTHSFLMVEKGTAPAKWAFLSSHPRPPTGPAQSTGFRREVGGRGQGPWVRPPVLADAPRGEARRVYSRLPGRGSRHCRAEIDGPLGRGGDCGLSDPHPGPVSLHRGNEPPAAKA